MHTPSIPFKKDDAGPAIAAIKRKLASLSDHADLDIRHAYTGLEGDRYDDNLELAIADFQKRNRLTPYPGCDQDTWNKLNEQAGSLFAEVWQYEFDALRGAAPDQVAPCDDAALTAKVHAASMAGLAFSGGGIRSATFNLGMLQAMGELKLLRKFDYLSTVSGGGYIGAWFSKWLHHEGGDIEALEQKLSPWHTEKSARKEPRQMRFLRQYSNYLTPKTGAFSADTWAAASTYVRNTVLNLTILVALMAAILIVPRLLSRFVDVILNATPEAGMLLAYLRMPLPLAGMSALAFIAIAAALFAVFSISVSISTVPDSARDKHDIMGQSQASVIRGVVLPLLVAAFFGSLALWAHRDAITLAWSAKIASPSGFFTSPIVHWLLAPGCLYFLAWSAGWWKAKAHNDMQKGHGASTDAGVPWRETFGHLVCAVAAFAVGTATLLLVIIELAKLTVPAAAMTLHLVAFGIPMLLGVFGLTMILSVGLVGRMYTEQSREWWSRQGGWTTIFVVLWVSIIAVSLYAPPLAAFVHHKTRGLGSAVMGSAWFGTTLAGLLLGSGDATAKTGSRPGLEKLAALAPYVFSIGAIVLVSAFVHALTSNTAAALVSGGAPEIAAYVAAYSQQTLASSTPTLWLALGAMLATGAVLAWRVDINKFSLHMMYRNRLVRAYLGASNPNRKAHPFTGFDANDDIHLDDLLKAGDKIQKPFHIVNAAMNLVSGDELAWQTRKAASFTFTPAFCGFELPNMDQPGQLPSTAEARRGAFRRTEAYRGDKKAPGSEEVGIKLGMTIAVSGAAASPNMGYHSSPPLAFLMTLFNLRLGRWFANTRGPRAGRRSTSPKVGLQYLIGELFGQADSNAEYVYLSDGGHFENLGVYELVRRRCRLIVVIDAGADGGLSFEDLGNAIRKCSTDLNIEIGIDVGKIDFLKDTRLSQVHCVAGSIHYDKADPDAPTGTLLYIKPSLLGKESADLLNYHKANATFPHESTADQWFNEDQFESYRALGYCIGMKAFEHLEVNDIDTLCAALDERWGPGSGTVHSLRAA